MRVFTQEQLERRLAELKAAPFCLSGTRTDGSEYCIIHDHFTKPAPPAKKLHGQETLD